MDPPLTKFHFLGINKKLIPKLSVLLVFVITFSAIEANAQVADDGQYALRVKTDPNILFIGGGGTYTAGTQVTIDEAPERWNEYSFVGWKIDGTWTEGNPISIQMNSPHTAVAVYSKEIGGSIIVDAIPRIAEITVDGTIYLPDELPVSFSWPEGSDHYISIQPIIKDNPETRYVFDSWKDKSVDKDRTVTIGPETQEFVALFKTQHYLKPITEYGAVAGAGWQDEGKTATFELESDIVIDKKDENVRYVFDSWDFGDYQNLPSNTIDIDEATTVRANWEKQYHVQLKTNIPDYDLFGTGWYSQDRKLALIAEDSLESPDSDIKYVFEKWVSKGPNPVIIPNAHSSATTITIEEPYIIEAQYKKAYRVDVWTPYGDALGDGFYDEGEIAQISISSNDVVVEPRKVRQVFSGWDTNGARTIDDFVGDEGQAAAPVTSAVQNLMVFVDKPTTITAMWKTQYYLDVQSTQGNTQGSGWYDIGRLVPISVDTRSTPPGMWSVHTFDRWTGDIESDSENERVIMNNPKTIIAEFRQDNTPGIINSIILTSVIGIGGFAYMKIQKPKLSFKSFKKSRAYSEDHNPFESYRENPFESNLQVPPRRPKTTAVMDWLMGR